MITFSSSRGRLLKSVLISSVVLLASVMPSVYAIASVTTTSGCIGAARQSDNVNEKMFSLFLEIQDPVIYDNQ